MTTEPAPQPQFLEAPELPDGVQRRRQPRWAPWMSVAALVAGFAGALFGALVLGVIAVAFGADFGDQPASVQILATIVQDLCLIASAILFARISGSVSPADFGLRPTRLRSAIGWAVLTWASFYVFTAAFVALVGASPNDDQLPKELGVDDSTVAMLAVAFLVAVVAPVAEEFFFRGFFFTALKNWRGLWPAAILTGLVFGAIHGSSADVAFLLPLAFFGFSLCLLYEKTGSLYPGIAVHCANNSIAFGATQDWTWQIPVLLVSSLAVIGLVALTVRAVWSPAPPAAAPAPAA
jgi:membrane protease YdiL (CAAX protease family)